MQKPQWESLSDNFIFQVPRIDDVFLYSESESDWETEADQRIEQLRKRDVQLEFVLADPGPANLTLEVRLAERAVSCRLVGVKVVQRTHQFGFGTAVQSLQISHCAAGGPESEYCRQYLYSNTISLLRTPAGSPGRTST